jgi:hypothetical protein
MGKKYVFISLRQIGFWVKIYCLPGHSALAEPAAI